ncbi:MAG: hypothetical protein CVU16_15250 [Betaproteobacteria bacterium HGW-Betaproteobacteria-10]|nr:MAG: hypothetical protein CVU16_15250 [Betaproteobacteria bacterium HGW-Betaproteobacteria-10]
MSTPTDRLIFVSQYAFQHTLVGVALGAILYWLIRAAGKPNTPVKLGREFAGFMVMSASALKGGTAILLPTADNLAAWAAVAFGFAFIGFACGLIFGKTQQIGASIYSTAKPHVQSKTGISMPEISEISLGKHLAWMAIPALILNVILFGSLLGSVMIFGSYFVIWLALSYAIFWWRNKTVQQETVTPVSYTSQIIECAKCSQKLRIPAQKRLEVTCPSCRTSFETYENTKDVFESKPLEATKHNVISRFIYHYNEAKKRRIATTNKVDEKIEFIITLTIVITALAIFAYQDLFG